MTNNFDSPFKKKWKDRSLLGKALSVLPITAPAAAAYHTIDNKRQKLKDEVAEAEQQRLAAQEEYKEFEFKNPYANMSNPFEDLTVNTQAADFAARQSAQQQADMMAGLKSAAGGAGVAGLAQVLAQQQQRNIEAATQDIASQEQQIQSMQAQGEQRLQEMVAGGEADVQAQEFGRTQSLLEMEMGREAGAAQAAQGFDQTLMNVGTQLASTALQAAIPAP